MLIATCLFAAKIKPPRGEPANGRREPAGIAPTQGLVLLSTSRLVLLSTSRLTPAVRP